MSWRSVKDYFKRLLGFTVWHHIHDDESDEDRWQYVFDCLVHFTSLNTVINATRLNLDEMAGYGFESWKLEKLEECLFYLTTDWRGKFVKAKAEPILCSDYRPIYIKIGKRGHLLGLGLQLSPGCRMYIGVHKDEAENYLLKRME